MPRDNSQKLGDVIRQLLKEQNLDGKLKEHRVVASWEEVMGKMIANHTTQIYVTKGTLFVHLDSPALKQELLMGRNQILQSVNDHQGEEVIKQVVIK